MSSLKAQIGNANLIMNVEQYLHNKRKRGEFTFRYFPTGESQYERAGMVFTTQEVDAAYPLPSSLLVRHNCDTSKSWKY